MKPISTHEKRFAVGNRGPKCHSFNLFFLGLGRPWVGEFVGFHTEVYLFSNLTEHGKSRKPLLVCSLIGWFDGLVGPLTGFASWSAGWLVNKASPGFVGWRVGSLLGWRLMGWFLETEKKQQLAGYLNIDWLVSWLVCWSLGSLVG